MKKFDVITCPFCGREYLPCEIFIPQPFVGRATTVFRDANEKIEGFVGTTMDLFEKYVCDSCSTPFTIKANVKFFVEELKKENMNREHETKLRPKYELKED